MKKWTFIFNVCLVIILAFVLGGSKPVSATTLEKKLYEAAKKEGVLEYWDSLGIKEINDLWKGFESKYPGIKLKYFEANAPVREERYLAEHVAGRHKVDIMPINLYSKFKEKGLLADLSDIIKDTGYPAKFSTKDFDAVGMEHSLKVPVYNTDLVSPQDAPRSWEDLLDPKWKGRINVETRMRAFIYAPGFWGEEKTLDYLKKLSKQEPSFTRGATYTMSLLTAGEFYISTGANLHRLIMFQERGAPIDWVGVNPIVDTISAFIIMKHAPNPNAAKLFLHWWMSPEGAAFVDAKRYKSNPAPGSGTRLSKALEKYGSPDIFAAPSWLDVDQTGLQKKCLQAVGYTKSREKIQKKKK